MKTTVIPMPRRGRGRGRQIAGQPNPIDVHVGQRIRLRRTLLGMSQQKLGEAIGLTFQQVQKYERGTNRVGGSRMFELARVLDVPVAYFYEEISAATATRGRQHTMGTATPPATGDTARDPMTKRETLELVRAYYRITDPKVRKRLFEMTKTLGSAAEMKAA
jgi:transcriptional regulator with XRE-family HTH domain